jgi:Cdc6-like AAA superfamily ATPase
MFLNKDNSICYFAETNFRNKRDVFGIRQKDRLHHFYILGRTGTGKTTLLETKISQDLKANRGICLIDVHGDLVNKVVKSIPEYRKKDVVYLDATNSELTLGYNPLRKVSYEKRPLVVSIILEVFQRLWGSQSWGIKLSHILRNVLLLLTDQPQTSFSDILKVLQDSNFRKECLQHVVSEDVKNFFEKEFKSVSICTLSFKVSRLCFFTSIITNLRF